MNSLIEVHLLWMSAFRLFCKSPPARRRRYILKRGNSHLLSTTGACDAAIAALRQGGAMGRRDEQREKEAQQLRTSRQQPPASRASISSVDIASMARRRPEGLDDLRDVRESMAHNWRASRGDVGPTARATNATPSGAVWRCWRWLRRRTWIFLGLGATAAAVVLCPDAASFSRYVRTRQAGPKGLLSGGLAWLQHRTGLRSSFKRLIVCSVATVGSRTFLGLFGSWVELPELPRSFPSRLQDVLPTNPEGDIDALVVANVATFIALQMIPERTIDRHFCASDENVATRPWTLLTAPFSHRAPMHLISNMHSLVTIAPLVQAALGRRRFLILYLGGGAVASLTSVLLNRILGRRRMGTLGASGAIFALLAANAAMFPEQRYSWWGGMELTSVEMLAATIALDAASGAMSERGVREGSPAARQLAQTQEMHELRSFMSPEIDVAAHAGGAAFGAAYYQFLVTQRKGGRAFLRDTYFG